MPKFPGSIMNLSNTGTTSTRHSVLLGRGSTPNRSHFVNTDLTHTQQTGGGGRGSDKGSIIGDVICHGKKQFWMKGCVRVFAPSRGRWVGRPLPTYRLIVSQNNPPPPPQLRSGNYHYHHGLKAGEGTLEASLVRLQVRGMNKKDGAFDQDTYMEDYIKCVRCPVSVGVCIGSDRIAHSSASSPSPPQQRSDRR